MNNNDNENLNNQNQMENNAVTNSQENKPLEVNNPVENKKNANAKVSIINYIFSVGISFILWNYLFIILFNIFVRSMIINNFSNNLTLALIVYNLAWTLTSVLAIHSSYSSNKKKKIDYENDNKAKYILLAIFYIFIIITNYQNIINHLRLNLIVTLFLILIHILAIWFSSIKFYNKFNGNLKVNRADRFVLLGIIIATSMVIIVGGFILEKRYSMRCIRNNGDVVDIKFNVEGIENVKINDKDMSEEDLVLYRLKLVTKFSLVQIRMSNATQSELIEEYKEEVSDFEEEHEEYKSTCSFDD